MRTTRDILASHLGDILATENHLLKAVEQQVNDQQVSKHSDANEFLSELRRTLQIHITRLSNRLDALGGSVTADVKEAVTAATGFAAGLFGRIRPQTASKFLRDNYVVLSACAIEYEMAHATALALRDQITADMALQNLKEVTPLIVRLSDFLPAIVVEELADQVGEVATGAALAARENTRRAWSSEAIRHEHV